MRCTQRPVQGWTSQQDVLQAVSYMQMHTSMPSIDCARTTRDLSWPSRMLVSSPQAEWRPVTSCLVHMTLTQKRPGIRRVAASHDCLVHNHNDPDKAWYKGRMSELSRAFRSASGQDRLTSRAAEPRRMTSASRLSSDSQVSAYSGE